MVSELRARGGATLLVAPVEPARANLRWPEKKQEMTNVLQDKLTLVELEIIGIQFFNNNLRAGSR